MYWYDGQLINSEQLQLKINDPGLLYGASVFSTMRVYEKSLQHPLTAWQAHCDRLHKSLKIFKWQQPNWQQLQQGAELLLTIFSVLRLVVFPDGREWITGRNLPPDLKQRQTEGITAWVARDSLYIYKRDLAQHKTGNYLGAYLARNQALSLNTQEAILIDQQGHWLETSTGNLWGWRDNCWYTPSLDIGILPGIARSRLFNYFQTQKIKVLENTWTTEFIQTLTAVFYSNCVVEIVPIKTILDAENQLHYNVDQNNWQELIKGIYKL